jgi:hypothetical protein
MHPIVVKKIFESIIPGTLFQQSSELFTEKSGKTSSTGTDWFLLESILLLLLILFLDIFIFTFKTFLAKLLPAEVLPTSSS